MAYHGPWPGLVLPGTIIPEADEHLDQEFLGFVHVPIVQGMVPPGVRDRFQEVETSIYVLLLFP